MRVGSAASLEWWRDHLATAGNTVNEIEERAGYPSLDFEDPEGQRLRLVNDGGAGEAQAARTAAQFAQHLEDRLALVDPIECRRGCFVSFARSGFPAAAGLAAASRAA